MNSVSTPAVHATHHAKKHGKSDPSGLPGADGGEFGGLFASMQAGMEGQDLAGQAGKASPPVEGLASQILGPSVHIITSETPALSDDSLYAFARSQGMDESALALIFQRNPQLPAAAAAPIDITQASVLAVGQEAALHPADATSDALLLAQRLNLQNAAALPTEASAKLKADADADADALPQPTTDTDGMSSLALGSEAKIRWSVGQAGSVPDAVKPTALKTETTTAAQASAAMTTAQRETHDAPARELAATLVLGEAESKQFAKKLETRQLSLRAERLGSTSSESFKTAFLNDGLSPETEAALAPTAVDSLSLGTELTGEDLRMIWAHRQASAEQNQSAAGQPGQANAPQSDIDLRAEQYEKLSQRLGEALGQRLAAQIARGDWKVELALKPQDLGSIEIKLGMKDGTLEASFDASEAMTRDLIADSLPKLKETLSQSGMEVAQVNVNVRQNSQNGGNPTPGRHKSLAGMSGVSKGSLAQASMPTDSMATGKPKAADNHGLDILV